MGTHEEYAADVVLVRRKNGGYLVTKDRYGAVPRIVSAVRGDALIVEHGARVVVRSEGA